MDAEMIQSSELVQNIEGIEVDDAKQEMVS